MNLERMIRKAEQIPPKHYGKRKLTLRAKRRIRAFERSIMKRFRTDPQ